MEIFAPVVIIPVTSGNEEIKRKFEASDETLKYIVIKDGGTIKFVFGLWNGYSYSAPGFGYHREVGKKHFGSNGAFWGKCVGGGYMKWLSEKKVLIYDTSGDFGRVDSDLLAEIKSHIEEEFDGVEMIVN